MRAICVAIIAVALLAGSAVGVGARSEDDRRSIAAVGEASAEASAPAASSSPDGEHQAPLLERALPETIRGVPTETSSLAGKAAQRQWDTEASPEWLLDWTCREREHLAMAILHGDHDVRAVRVAGADTEGLREAYLQDRRYSDGIAELEERQDHVHGWIATAGWRPEERLIEDRIVDYYPGEDEGLYVYVVGDIIFEVEADEAMADEIVRLLPTPGTDTSVFGPPVEPAAAGCPGPRDAELHGLLPKAHEDIEQDLDPWPVPYSFVARIWPRFVKVTDASPSNLSGYLYIVPASLGAFRITEADATKLERGCAALHASRRKALKRVEVDGRYVLRVRNSGSSCFVRGDMLFFFPDTETTWILESASDRE